VATKVVNRARIDITQTAENEPSRRGGDLIREFLHRRQCIGLASRLRECNSKGFREHDGARQL
jgi:hypothetical protein